MAEDKIKLMDLKEFIDLGYLQEVNRQFFHPLGLALSVSVDDEERPTLYGIWDNREDGSGIIFDEGVIDKDKADYISKQFDEKAKHRLKSLNYIFQPVK